MAKNISNDLGSAVDSYFDDLVKSRFIELFGHADKNEKGFPIYLLDDLSTVITDGSHFSPVEVEDGPYPMLSVKDMCDNGFDYTNAKRIDESTYKSLVSSGCQPLINDVLIAKDGATAFQKGFVFDNCEPQVLLSSIAIIRPDMRKVNPNYLLSFLFSESIRHDVLRNRVSGTAITRIILKELKKIPVMLPPLGLQNEFVEFVKQVDKSKFVMRKLVSKYDELIKSRFIELFDGCEKVPLTDLADVVMGQSPESSSYNDEGKGMPFFQGKTEFGDTFVTVNKYCTAPKKVAKPMDILMSVRAPVGSVNLTEFECCIGRGLAAITPKKSTDVWFLFNALKTMEKQISDMGVGSTFTAIGKDDMKKIKIPSAPLDLQKEFSSFVQQVDKSKFEIRKVLDNIITVE